MLVALAFCAGAFFLPLKAHAGGPDWEDPAPAETAGPDADVHIPVSASADPNLFTPDGQGEVLDSATDGDGKDFYTVTTPDGNVFYLIIDHGRDADNVYFLKAVTEADLYALTGQTPENVEPESAVPEQEGCTCAEKCAAGAVDVSCPLCRNDLSVCTGREADRETEEMEEPVESGTKSGGAASVLVLLAALVAGGAGYYLKIYKPKRELDDAEDLDELLDDGPEVNEDGEQGE